MKYMMLCSQTVIHSYYEQWAQCANGLPRARGLRPGAGWRWDGLQGLGSTQLSGAGHLQPPLGPGSLMEETLPQQGQAQSLQPDLSPAVWLCHGECITFCDKSELLNVCDSWPHVFADYISVNESGNYMSNKGCGLMKFIEASDGLEIRLPSIIVRCSFVLLTTFGRDNSEHQLDRMYFSHSCSP